MKLPRWLHIVLNVYALMLAAFFVWPVLQVCLCAFTSDIVFPPRMFSLTAWQGVIWPGYLKSIWFSMRMAVGATVLLLLICTPAAYAMERRKFRGRAALSVLVFVPLIFPTITYSSAIRIYVFSFFNQWTGTYGLVTLVTAMWGIPLVMRSIQGSLATSDPVYEEAAVTMGASPVRSFFKITLPLIAPGVLTAAMIAFTSTAMAFTAPYILGSTTPAVSQYVFQDIGRIGFLPWIAVEVLLMEAIILGVVQVLNFVFRKQLRGVFV
jgi:ABC-type spermidine/putrescine transport system permease subunit II